MRLIFRLTENNRYSFIPLFHAIYRYNPKIDFEIFEGSIEDLKLGVGSIVFYSFTTMEVGTVLRELKHIRRNYPGTLVVAGGCHVSALPNWSIELGFDAVVVGEGELVFESILKDLSEGGLKRRIYFGRRPDSIDYSFIGSPYVAPIEIVRGCPYGCKFCQVSYLFGRKERYRSLDSVINEAKILVERGRRFVRFIAPNALSYYSIGKVPNIGVLRDLFIRLRDVGIEKIYFGSFPSEIRPDYVNEESVKLLREFVSNRNVVIGVQSASDELLVRLNRGHDVASVLRAVELFNSYDFEVTLDFLFGLPEERDDDLKVTLGFMERILNSYNVKIRAHYYMPLPMTPYGKLEPRELPKWFTASIADLAKSGRVKGYWHRQREEGRKVWEMIKGFLG